MSFESIEQAKESVRRKVTLLLEEFTEEATDDELGVALGQLGDFEWPWMLQAAAEKTGRDLAKLKEDVLQSKYQR